MGTVASGIAGLGLLVIGTGLLGSDLRALLGLAIFAYGLAVFAGLALRDAILRLAELFDAWQTWEPDSVWYGRPDQYHGRSSSVRGSVPGFTNPLTPRFLRKRSITRREKEITA